MNLSCWLTEWWEKEMEQKPLSDVELRCVCVCVRVPVCACFLKRFSQRWPQPGIFFGNWGSRCSKKTLTNHHNIRNLLIQNYIEIVDHLIQLSCTGRDQVAPMSPQSVRIRWTITDTQLFIHQDRGLPSRPTWRGSDSTTTCRVWMAIAHRGLRRGLDCSDIYTQSFPWEPGTLINIAPLAPLLF